MNKIKICLLSFAFGFLLSAVCFAEKITILYTGGTHGALYHCDCPVQPDGGLGRRMSKVKELRLENPNTILVDAGGFFPGGQYDQHTQGVELDQVRNQVNLKALEKIGYDALGLSDEEFNFGKDYLIQQIQSSKAPFLSANLKVPGAFPYLIKKTANASIAIIGLTNNEAQAKSGGQEVESAEAALKTVIPEVKNRNVNVIVVLSYLGEEKDKQLLQDIKDIDVIICGHPGSAEESYLKVDSRILARASWQGRRLGKVDLELEGGKVKNSSAGEFRLSDQVPDAPEMSKIVPQCFADSDCRKKGFIGKCLKAASLEAVCSFDKPKSLSLLIVQPKTIFAPNQDKFINFLKNNFPGIEPRFIDSDSKPGKAWIEKTQAKLLPIYLLAKEVENQPGFQKAKESLELKEGYYYISPRLAGGSIFIGRQVIPDKLDVFLSTKGKNVEEMVTGLKDLRLKYPKLDITLHYTAFEAKDGFNAQGGLPELEEDIRQVCVKRYQPDKFWDYALCRAKHQESTWWDACAEQFGIEAPAIKKCGRSSEGMNLLKENIQLNKDLEVSRGMAFLVNNTNIFMISKTPPLDEWEKILKLKEVKK